MTLEGSRKVREELWTATPQEDDALLKREICDQYQGIVLWIAEYPQRSSPANAS